MLQIASRYLKGEAQWDIAKDLGLNQSTVSRDLKRIKARWLESTLVNFDEAVGEQLARINELERTYWEAWSLSMKERRRVTDKGKGSLDAEQPQLVEKIVTVEQPVGDSRFLTGVQWCIQERSKLLGLNAPTKSEVGGLGGGEVLLRVIYETTDIITGTASIAPYPALASG